jgi:hypothetical protein
MADSMPKHIAAGWLLLSALAAQDPGTSYRFAVHEPRPVVQAELRQAFDPCSCRQLGAATFEVIVAPDELPRFQALELSSGSR